MHYLLLLVQLLSVISEIFVKELISSDSSDYRADIPGLPIPSVGCNGKNPLGFCSFT